MQRIRNRALHEIMSLGNTREVDDLVIRQNHTIFVFRQCSDKIRCFPYFQIVTISFQNSFAIVQGLAHVFSKPRNKSHLFSENF